MSCRSSLSFTPAVPLPGVALLTFCGGRAANPVGTVIPPAHDSRRRDSPMHLEPYRRVLALPGVRSLMIVAMVARIPPIAAGFALTLHVVLDLGRGYGAAGLV